MSLQEVGQRRWSRHLAVSVWSVGAVRTHTHYSASFLIEVVYVNY